MNPGTLIIKFSLSNSPGPAGVGASPTRPDPLRA